MPDSPFALHENRRGQRRYRVTPLGSSLTVTILRAIAAMVKQAATEFLPPQPYLFPAFCRPAAPESISTLTIFVQISRV
jgi:hypothetical protein